MSTYHIVSFDFQVPSSTQSLFLASKTIPCEDFVVVVLKTAILSSPMMHSYVVSMVKNLLSVLFVALSA